MVFVDDAAEDSSAPYVSVERDDPAWVMVGWMLMKALVWTVPVEMLFVLPEH